MDYHEDIIHDKEYGEDAVLDIRDQSNQLTSGQQNDYTSKHSYSSKIDKNKRCNKNGWEISYRVERQPLIYL